MGYYFYRTNNLINNKFYYGSGAYKDYYGSGKILKRAISKYGKENFEVKILKYFNTREEAFAFEDRFLKLYKISSNAMSYNIKDSAVGGDVITHHPDREGIIKRKSEKARGKKRSNEFRLLLSEIRKGDKNPMYGKKISKEVIQKQRETFFKNRYGEEYKIKMAEVDERNKIIKEPIKGKTMLDFPNFENNKRYDGTIYHLINDDGTEEICTKYVMHKKYNLHRSHFLKVLKRKSNSHKGWRLISKSLPEHQAIFDAYPNLEITVNHG